MQYVAVSLSGRQLDGVGTVANSSQQAAEYFRNKHPSETSCSVFPVHVIIKDGQKILKFLNEDVSDYQW